MAMGLLPNIGPLDSSFPLFGAPRLRVVARGEGVPIARSDTVLDLEVTNVSPGPVGVASVRVGYRYTNALSEAVLGKRAPELPLRELSSGPSVPATLQPGETVVWAANLGQVAEEARARGMTHRLHPLFLEPRSVEEELGRDFRLGRAGVALDNTARAWTHRRLAVVVRDEDGAVYKTKVRWLPPGGAPPDLRVPSSTRA